MRLSMAPTNVGKRSALLKGRRTVYQQETMLAMAGSK